MSEKIKNVFISHAHEDDAELGKLKDLVARHGLEIRDSSIRSENPNNASDEDYIKSGVLAPQIRWAGVTLVLVSREARNSSWVDWEINYANKLDKHIVGVYARGAGDDDIPPALDKYGDSMVPWDGKRIIDAITGNTREWHSANGEPRSGRTIRRHGC
ncbi:MAG: TIR domain-containing protein [Alphaproteobacteria bacterium]|nr:TIR domain-containing protein [Alphaproteobacteria bacterium]